MGKHKQHKKKNHKKKKLKGRSRRLELAPTWVAAYSGKPNTIIKKYRSYFHVDWECAITELCELGVEIDPQYLTSLRQTISQQSANEKIHNPITRFEFDVYRGADESDENFAYIAGYTAGGLPYGTTWDEMD